MCKRLSLFIIVFLTCCQVAASDKLIWPDLPSSGFIVGRLATKADVKAGNAVFHFDHINDTERAPLDIKIPQYAIRYSKIAALENEPVIIIQAESIGTTKLLGYRNINTSRTGSGLLSEFNLLGTRKPD